MTVILTFIQAARGHFFKFFIDQMTILTVCCVKFIHIIYSCEEIEMPLKRETINSPPATDIFKCDAHYCLVAEMIPKISKSIVTLIFTCLKFL